MRATLALPVIVAEEGTGRIVGTTIALRTELLLYLAFGELTLLGNLTWHYAQWPDLSMG
jgi:hypothetical protein